MGTNQVALLVCGAGKLFGKHPSLLHLLELLVQKGSGEKEAAVGITGFAGSYFSTLLPM